MKIAIAKSVDEDSNSLSVDEDGNIAKSDGI